MSVAMQVAERFWCRKRSANEQETYPLPDPISTHLDVRHVQFAGRKWWPVYSSRVLTGRTEVEHI